MTTATAAFAKEIGDNVHPQLVGFDPITIISLITTLLPVFAGLLKGCQQTSSTSATDPRSFLEDHYDVNTDSFDTNLIQQARPHTRRAARQQGLGRLSRDQLDTISQETFLKSMHASDATVAAVMAESA